MDFNKRNYYAEFIQEEVDFYLKEANFDSRERLLFLLRNNKAVSYTHLDVYKRQILDCLS